MLIKKEAIVLARPEGADAIRIANQLGELPLDLRRRGIPALVDPVDGGLRLKSGTGNDYTIKYEDPVSVLERLSLNEEVSIVGLTLQYRRNAILVREDSLRRSISDLRGGKLGIARDGHPADDIRKREAESQVENELVRAGLYPGEIKWAEIYGAVLPGNVVTGRRELQALLSGDVDAVYTGRVSTPEANRLIGVRELEAFVAYSPVLAILTVSPEWIREAPAEVERILAHISLAASWAYSNRSEANRLAAKQLGLPEDAIESIYSEKLHKQFGTAITDENWASLLSLKAELLTLGWLERDFSLDDAVEQGILQRVQLLINNREVESPQAEPITPYIERDLPRSFFTDRAQARQLTSDVDALEAARTFAQEIAPNASDRDRRRQLPLKEMKRLAELGLLGLVVPKAYGGPDVSTRTLVDVFKLISKADGSIGQIPQNHHFFVKTIELIGTEEQKRYFFGEVLKGAQFGNALAERSAGKGAKKISTTLRESKEPGVYELSGSKYYSTGALYSHWIPVTALDENERRMTAFVPRHAAGVTVLDDWSGIGQRTTASGSVVLRNVNVPEHHLLHHWRIFEGPQYFSAFGQIMHAAIDIGIAQAALEDAAIFVREQARPLFGSGLTKASEEPDLIRRFGELGIRLQAAEALLDHAADAIDAARLNLSAETAGHATMTVDSAKWLASETAVEITNALFEVAGTSSMDRKHNYDRHWRNVRIHTLHDPARLKLHHVGKWFLNGLYHEYKM